MQVCDNIDACVPLKSVVDKSLLIGSLWKMLKNVKIAYSHHECSFGGSIVPNTSICDLLEF